METKVKRREWVKTAAIIFLSVLLVLTFFSNTIMNRSLPEVAAQYVESGTINARIRGTGTVSANEVYEVTLAQTRKVRSVLVRNGQEVAAGDPLLQLESRESEELKAAKDTLEQMELNYQKTLIEMSNANSTEDRAIAKLREAYDEALAAYRIHSHADPDRLALQLEEAQVELSALQMKQQELQTDLSRLEADRAYLDAKTDCSVLESEHAAKKAAYDDAESRVLALEQLDADIKQRQEAVARQEHTTVEQLYADYETFQQLAGSDVQICAYNLDFFMNVLSGSGETLSREDAQTLQNAYNAIVPIVELQLTLPGDVERQALERTYADAAAELSAVSLRLHEAEELVEEYETEIDRARDYLDHYADAILAQQAAVTDLQQAASAGQALKAAEEALEDALFQASLGDSSSLDMQKAREDIDAQKLLVEELTLEADGQEITAPVGGTVTNILVSAGGTAAAEQTVVEITVSDRGYTVPISVTNEQARQVRIGDTADITNYYWGGITATLENIANDPQSMGQNKMLIFRIEGEGVEAGTNLSLSIGQRSANYDCLVPNSAIRSDANGSFVLVVQAKSSPLGNRYVATRADVQVLASDDTTSAVSGLANGDFVITTSNRPLEAGESVRLPDNG